MFSLRVFIIAGICCILVPIGLFFYVKYDTQRFAASLPETPVFPNQGDGTSEIEPLRLEADILMDTAARVTAADAIATQKQLASLRNALSFDFTDRQATYTRLAANLRAVYADDPKVERFLVLWTAMSDILHEMEADENGGDLAAFLELSLGATLNEFVGLGIELLKLNDTDAAAVRAAAAHWADTVYRLEIANEALPYIQADVNTGEMTLDEAKTFFKVACDLDIDIEIVK